MLCIVASIAVVLYIYKIVENINIDLVDISQDKKPPAASQVYDSENNYIASFFLEERYYKPLSEISQEFQDTLISAEDERFYMHRGFDLKGILRAIWYKVSRGGNVHGGSTITQQLARSELYLNQTQKEIKRKITEIFLAYHLEKKFTKEQILEKYANQVPFGYNTRGVEAAARRYFGKNASELNYAEAAMICGALPAPSILNPTINPEKAKNAQLNVLRKLRDNGYITEEQRQQFAEMELEYKRYSDIGYRDNINFFIDYVKSEMNKLIDDPTILQEGGLKIYTTLNWNYQQHAEASIDEFYESKFKNNLFKKDVVSDTGTRQPQSSLVATNPKTGEILAMMGGRNYNESEFNRAVSPQPPGSSFKIFDYTCAIENRALTGGSLLMSDDFMIEDYAPDEWSRSIMGPYTVRTALVKSSNKCALRAGFRPGLEKVAYTANKMGITTEVLPYPSMTVGGMNVKAVDMACAYGCLATNGNRNDPFAVKRVEGSDGREIYRHQVHPVQVISEETSWIMTNIFRSVHLSHGSWKLGFDIAGKTGTSGEKETGWYCCFSPDIVVVAFTGIDDRTYDYVWRQTPYGSNIGFPIAKKFMTKCANDSKFPIPKSKFPQKPKNVSTATICKQSGHLVTEYCPEEERAPGYFLEGTSPGNYCQFHAEPTRFYSVFVDEDGTYFQPVSSSCPTEQIRMTKREFELLPVCEESDCPPVLRSTCWKQPSIENSIIQCGENLEFTAVEGMINTEINLMISEEFIDSIDSVTLTIGDMMITRWKIGDYVYAENRSLTKEDFLSGLSNKDIRYTLPPEGESSEIEILIELNGPNNFYNVKRYVATIINP